MRTLLHGRARPLERFKVALPDSLRKFLEEAEIVDRTGVVVFTGGFKDDGKPCTDPTGVECLINKVHMDEFLPGRRASLRQITRIGISYALALRKKIRETKIAGDFRIIVSASRSLAASRRATCPVGFHVLRKNNPWLVEDIESYKHDAVLTIDWTNPS